ncbi:beta-lactamase regulating signal transducer with metallopeptidase domain [Roseimicrobium gellanilyticum]|uniref:Beta-lactamase regulating signal transducer with metallopeptidase domain n=1 Tax=Roseimicrobium gellanilyticum TaxID=748857 RepID=A0A366HKB3_9BACT|nr:M56 family metallopeptidase [Roseimicrobium gellanilyticum]RBP42550.1 beta-lactamase regulating signal transducer with metallopeptidase domain [Roseimicrobium gellanilyticum]
MNLPDSLTSGLVTAATWAWNTSLIILLPALVVLLLGRWQSFPARWRSWLAAIVVVRLLLPWVPEVSWRPSLEVPLQHAQVAPLTQRSEVSLPVEMVPIHQGLPDEGVAAERGHALSETTAVHERAFAMPSLWSMAVWLWLAGLVSVAAWIVYSHVVLHHLISRHRTRTDTGLFRELEWCQQRMGVAKGCGLWTVRGLPTMAVHGWLRPVILVPEGLSERFSAEEIRGMFLHELAHVRRGDLIWGRVLLAVCALHWFNPLVWLLARRMRADAELECDRIALEKLSHTQRSHYGEALLKTLENSLASVPVPAVPFFRHTKEIQTRIQMIALPRSSAVARYAALLIVPALACLTFTTASADPDGQPRSTEEKSKGDGEQAKTGPRDGEAKKDGPRDGEAKSTGPRDGEVKKTGPRDGEEKKSGPRDGEERKTGARDGEGKREGVRDGEAKKTGLRDGEGQKKGPRDGEGRKEGMRDGEGSTKRGARDGEAAKSGRDGAEGQAVVLLVTDKGEQVKIGNETIPVGRLRGYLSEHGAGMTLQVQADADVPDKAVAEVIDAARDNKVKVVSSRDGREGRGTKSASSEER